ncbi:GH12 family glycosyl hydrolase domain-containing protein [Wenjunlia tyrosinilytica]|uniref:Glycosyl hydrolase family 5 n=1 Tax=Wenjunlia tyrosinilytica TaxID=1544741 RepID=A0A918DZT7_9ACTN|nr:cellulose binding domain-containing protein [Wenjunlia tyrosinilytica]GGO90862.1 glycosyl hydrolase family 5 [Wenjunlia tyrosinilytica]
MRARLGTLTKRRLCGMAAAAAISAAVIVPIADALPDRDHRTPQAHSAPSVPQAPPPGATGTPVAGAPAPLVSTCEPSGTIRIAKGEHTLQNNSWNSAGQGCVAYDGDTAWRVSQADYNLSTAGPPAAYPSLYKGCHWGACTAKSGLPAQVADLETATTSWDTEPTATGVFNTAYDLWFNSTPTTSGQPDGTELMIWLDKNGDVRPYGSKTGTAFLDGRTWDVWTGRQVSWNVISYVLPTGVASVSDLDVKALIDDATMRGSINRSHYFISAEAGFEIWQGGKGLATKSFSFDTTAAAGVQASPEAAPQSAVPGPSGSASASGAAGVGGSASASSSSSASSAKSCSAVYRVESQWSDGFTASVTVTNTGSTPLNSWKVNWTWPGSQSLGSLWEAVDHGGGSTQTVTNTPSNGTVAAGGKVTFGLSGLSRGTNAAPTPVCTAG